MNYKKTIVATVLTATMCLGAVATAEAAIIGASWSGLFAMLDPDGKPMTNTSSPYIDDPDWGYGLRTQVAGTFTFDTSTGTGSATVNAFGFMNGGWVTHYIEMQAIGDGMGGEGTLVAAKWLYDWSGNLNINAGFILDASGFLGSGPYATSQAISGVGAIPASNDMKSGKYPIGSAPIVTTVWDTDYHNDPGCVMTLSCLVTSGGASDNIGGAPLDNGPYLNYSPNLDITYITIDSISEVPVPAAVWLLGSGVMVLLGATRRSKQGLNCRRNRS